MSIEKPPNIISIRDILDSYDAFFIDAYGVLVDGTRALPGANTFITALESAGKDYVVVTNDASRSQKRCSERLASLGVEIAPEKFITSGSLIIPFFQEHGLEGKKTMVFGPEDSRDYVTRAGGSVVPIELTENAEIIVAADDAGYPFLESLEIALSVLYRLIDGGGEPTLILPNPDLIYPKGPGEFGFTSGAVSLLLEAGLTRRYPDRPWAFTPLGKPHPAIFEEAQRRTGGKRAIMIGDQLQTDILGARKAGIDAALLLTGICPELPNNLPFGPTWGITSLEL